VSLVKGLNSRIDTWSGLSIDEGTISGMVQVGMTQYHGINLFNRQWHLTSLDFHPVVEQYVFFAFHKDGGLSNLPESTQTTYFHIILSLFA
jgi:hypothetical protein